jgi:solute carrier family 25 aspartate/glutamate transporter 12/13
MPGSAHKDTSSLEPSVGLEEAKAPLPYLRSRNALKVILDLDENFGRPKMPAGTQFSGIPGFGKKPEA